MMNEATVEAISLLYGNRLPHPSNDVYRIMETPIPTVKFNQTKTLGTLENLQVNMFCYLTETDLNIPVISD